MAGAIAAGLAVPLGLVGLALGHRLGDSSLEVALTLVVFGIDLVAASLLFTGSTAMQLLGRDEHELMHRSAAWTFGAATALALVLVVIVILGGAH